MSTLATIFARNLRTTLLAALLLFGAGVYAAIHLRRETEPRLHEDYVVMRAALAGSTAGELLDTVTTPVEELLRSTPGVVDFDSRTADGVCVFTAKLRRSDPLEVRERLRSRLSELHTTLAQGIVGLKGPQLDDSASTTYDFVAGIAAPNGDLKKLREALPAMKRELLSVPGVESVEITGLPAEQVVVEYADTELADAGLSPLLLSAMLKSQSMVAPGGYLDDRKTISPLHIDGRLRTLEDLQAVGVLDPVTGRATTLERLLEVKTESRTPPAPSVSVGGRPGVQIAIARRADADIRKFSTQLRSSLDTTAMAAGLERPAVLIDAAAFIERDYRSFARGLLVSGGIIFILLVAIMGFRVGGLVALMLPLSLFSTLAVLLLAGFKMNIVVLAGLTIASGIIADNHIVVAQFISRRKRRGESRAAAVTEAFRVLSGPLLAATLTAIAGFLPVLLTHHAAGEYVAELAPVVAIALGFSYCFAFALTPFLCRASSGSSPLMEGLEGRYKVALGAALRHPVAIIVACGCIAFAGIRILRTLPTAFFPANQSVILAVEVLLPAGASQSLVESDMAAMGKRIAKALQETGTDASASWMTLSGRDIPRISSTMLPSPALPNYAVALVSFDAPPALKRFRARLAPAIASDKSGAMIRLREISGGPQMSWPIKIRLTGSADATNKAAAQARKTLLENPSLARLHEEAGGAIAKWTLTPKRKAAADKAVTPADIALAMNATLDGLPCFELGEGDLATPVIIRSKRTDTDPVDNLKDAYVYPSKGRPCVLSDVAEVASFNEPASFERQRGVPAITFAADCVPGANPYEVETVAVQTLRKVLAGSGVQVESAGLAETAGAANHALLAKAPWALAAVFLILLAHTRSTRLTLLVLGVIPLGMAGAGFGLALFGLSLGFMPLIGLIATAGIAVNIAIVMAASLSDQEAGSAGESEVSRITQAATDRLEPILLSALSAFGGMIPLYIFGGPLWHSMAVTLVSGLLVAAALLVFVIPCTFLCLRQPRLILESFGMLYRVLFTFRASEFRRKPADSPTSE